MNFKTNISGIVTVIITNVTQDIPFKKNIAKLDGG